MKISFLLVGKTDLKSLLAGMTLYEERIKRYSDYKRIEIPELKSASSLSKSEIKEKEGDLILKQIKPQDELVLLDIEGRSLSSEEFASFMEKRGVYGTKGVVFVAGGAYGFSDSVYSRANYKLSLSSMTFSHQLVRLIFLEQLYRAFTIIKGEPYHHG
ncbi:MAG: Ribosomal RNA large subunit methyltransferase H [uncultured bacterium]|nr:MAG: Ribosomal RNA large subunit methyltransferase H [uncultured bacterium]HBY01101.1 23S rRNA (pseudouridine(1915)-N(3))-methyltransferase RlmH [Rikenellaceae bacterium]